jgi:tmRNA-binding protein
MFRSKDYMTQEQQSITEDFLNMIETEYALCVQEIKRANGAIVDSENDEENRKLDLTNREIDSISKYWQIRLGHLIEFIETKSHKKNEELARKYLSHQ